MKKDFNTLLIQKLKTKKVEGITRRWLILIIGLIVLLFIIVFILGTAAIKTYYYNSVEKIVLSSVSDSTVNYFENCINSGESLESAAALYIDSYSNKDSTTAWIIDNDGNVVISSNGFAVDKQDMPDYVQAQKSNDDSGKFVGRVYGHQKVMVHPQEIASERKILLLSPALLRITAITVNTAMSRIHPW